MKLKPVIKIDNWLFELKEIKCIRAKNYGDKYSGIGTIKIIDGEPVFESVLCDSSEPFSIQDGRALVKFLKQAGFDSRKYIRINVDKEKRIIKKGG